MKRLLAAFLLASLAGCGASLGSTSAVENVTFGELVVASKLQRHHTRDDEQAMLKRLRVSVPFDVDKKLGKALSENHDISEVQITSKDIASDATAIDVSFKVKGGFDVKLSFIAQRMSLGVVDLVKTPYLMNFRVSKGDIDLGSLDGTFPFLGRIYVTQDIATVLQGIWNEVEAKRIVALKRKEAEEREKKIQNFIGEWEPNPELSELENKAAFSALQREAEAKFPL